VHDLKDSRRTVDRFTSETARQGGARLPVATRPPIALLLDDHQLKHPPLWGAPFLPPRLESGLRSDQMAREKSAALAGLLPPIRHRFNVTFVYE